MRIIVQLAAICLATLVSSCNMSYAWHLVPSQCQRALGIHTQSPIPGRSGRIYRNTSSQAPTRPLPRPRTAAPKPNCGAVCVIDPLTGNVLYGHNMHERRQVASTQKIITALCACDAGHLNSPMTIQQSDKTSVSPIRSKLRVGESYTRMEIMHAMLTASCNDLAQALARDSAGSVDLFVKRMNARARSMGMHNSLFANPSGLPAPQYSTAYDMARAACYAYMKKEIRDCINDQQIVLTRPNGQQVIFNNTNKLLPKYSWVQGMKTGYTNAAKRCLISCGSINGRAVIVVVLGCEKPRIWDESEKYLRWALNV